MSPAYLIVSKLVEKHLLASPSASASENVFCYMILVPLRLAGCAHDSPTKRTSTFFLLQAMGDEFAHLITQEEQAPGKHCTSLIPDEAD
jgi:hypothetical protein